MPGWGSKVVVTGIGAVTPIGSGREELWQGLLAGRCGIGPVRSFDTSAYRVHRGAEIPDFDPGLYLRRLDPAEVGRASQLAAAAARLALRDAGIDELGDDRDDRQKERVGVVMGTTSGEPREVERYNDARQALRPDDTGGSLVERYPCHQIAAAVADEVGARGAVTMIPTACAAGNYALAWAFDALRSGRAEMMLAGGADCFSRITYTGFARLGAIAADTCRPFDRSRDGMIPGEGSGVLVLETLEGARARGARVYAEVAGYGLSCDAHHMTAAHPQGDGAARAMEQALCSSGIAPGEVSWVSAHGTGTPTNDRLEVAAVRRVFGGGRTPPMSSIKSMLGHTMGAASAIEAAACCLAVTDDVVPPTIHFEAPDDGVDLDFVPNTPREQPVRVAMNNAYAFGGSNASVLFREVAT